MEFGVARRVMGSQSGYFLFYHNVIFLRGPDLLQTLNLPATARIKGMYCHRWLSNNWVLTLSANP